MRSFYTLSIYSLLLFALPSYSLSFLDSFLGEFSMTKAAPKKENFFGLYFTKPHSWTCKTEVEVLKCINAQGAQISLTKQLLPKPKSLPLLRINRKQQWEKEGLNHYVESKIKSPLGEITKQEARKLVNDNILSPVLISAFDVVIGMNCVSFTAQCGSSQCSELDRELNDLVSSFSKTPRK